MKVESKFCSECGALLEENDHFCPVCGAKVAGLSEQKLKKSPKQKAPSPPAPKNTMRSIDDSRSKKNTEIPPKSEKEMGQNNKEASAKDNKLSIISWVVLSIVLLVLAGGIYIYTEQKNQKNYAEKIRLIEKQEEKSQREEEVRLLKEQVKKAQEEEEIRLRKEQDERIQMKEAMRLVKEQEERAQMEREVSEPIKQERFERERTEIESEKLLRSRQNKNSSYQNYPFVCYDKKTIIKSDKAIYERCFRSKMSCQSIGKFHFGKYPNDFEAHKAFIRCLKSNPKFIDTQGL